MNSETDRLEDASQTLNLKTAIGVTAFLGLVGVYFYLIYGWSYIDFTMIPYILVYTGVLAGLYLALKKFKILQVILWAVLAAVVFMVSAVKMNWSKAYFESAEPFMFEAYIDKYPTWEEHLVSPILKKPDWVAFATDCGQALRENTVGDMCKTYQSIQERYNINVPTEIDAYLGRMRHTASLVKKRGSMNGAQYRSCVLKKECAEIPFLMQDAGQEKANPADENYQRVSKAFWDLADGKPLSPEVCGYMTLCKVVRATGALSLE